MSDTPDKGFTMPTPAQAVAEENVRLERERDAALDVAMELSENYRNWRECAERLAVSIAWSLLVPTKSMEAALAEFERLKGETK